MHEGVAGSLAELGERFMIDRPSHGVDDAHRLFAVDHLDAAIAAIDKGLLLRVVLDRLH